MVLLEGIEEFHEDFVFSLVASNDSGVFLGVVSLSDVVNVENAGAILVQDLESFHGKVGSELVHLANDATEELIVLNFAIVVNV